MNNNVFFAENGLTSTSANHVANLAKEYVQDIESRLANIKLYRSEVALIGTEGANLLSDGELRMVESSLTTITEAKSLIAWLREAIKARSGAIQEAEDITIEDWAAKQGITLPEYPKRADSVTESDVIASLNIKERNRIFALQTKAATFGKYVHPDGNFARARRDLLKKRSEQNSIEGSGRDALLYHYTPTCDAETVESVFFALQKMHRETQAELNKIQHEIQEKVRSENMKSLSIYTTALNSYKIEMEQYQARFQRDKQEILKGLAELKIVIPNELKGIYEKVNKLGK